MERGDTAVSVADEDVRAAWSAHARDTDLDAVAAKLEVLDVWVTTAASTLHPPAIAGDIDPAPIVFRLGRVPDATAPAVAIVGTRRCTPTGRSVAMELGSGLASAGVTVVSGLALGIGGAAPWPHREPRWWEWSAAVWTSYTRGETATCETR